MGMLLPCTCCAHCVSSRVVASTKSISQFFTSVSLVLLRTIAHTHLYNTKIVFLPVGVIRRT